MEYLALGDYLVIASRVLEIDAKVLAKATNLSAADSALHAPQASFGGVEFYPEMETKVAVLGYRLTRNHALPDGNKRTAFMSMIELAERNRRTWHDLDVDDTVETMIGVASGEMSEESFVAWVTERLDDGGPPE